MAFREDGVDVHLDERGEPRIVERRFIVEPELAGHRLDHFLVRKIPRLSRTRAQAIIRETVTFADGRPAKSNSRLSAGETVIMRRRASPEPPCPRRFDVLHRDDHVMVIDKPAGLPVHISARYYFNTLTRVISERFPGEGWQICHRLDRETSGALVLARGRDSARVVKRAFERKLTRKRYVAIAYGVPMQAQFDIDLPLGLTDDPSAKIALRMVVRESGLPSRTDVEVIETLPGADGLGPFCLLACRPVSGRQHQIRAHLAAIGHPIVGDKLYAHGDDVFAAACDELLDSEQKTALLLSRHALHAERIAFPHPDGDELEVSAPMPKELSAFIETHRATSIAVPSQLG